MGSDGIFILGMHRSGTSAVAGVLSMAGINSGSELMPGVLDVNPKGFWEHAGIVDIHERLLVALDSSWDDESPLPDGWWQQEDIACFRDELLAEIEREFLSGPLWMLKDPRLCRLLPLWLDIIDELKIKPHFVICLRHPEEVSLSLQRRDGIMESRSCLLWLEHVMVSERLTRGCSRVIVSYESLLADWRTEIRRMEEAWSISLPMNDASERDIDAFLDPSLRHYHHAKHAVSDGAGVCDVAMDVYETVLGGIDAEGFAKLAAIENTLLQTVSFVDSWSDEIYMLRRDNALLKSDAESFSSQNIALRSEIDRIKSTLSWRITKPLRMVRTIERFFAGLMSRNQ